MKTNKPLLGLALACLTLSLASCANKPQNVRTETVTVERPVIVAVPSELTDVPAEPVLPPGDLTNADVADHLDALRAWGRGLAGKLREIAGLAVDE